jgi:hypothetical protein
LGVPRAEKDEDFLRQSARKKEKLIAGKHFNYKYEEIFAVICKFSSTWI